MLTKCCQSDQRQLIITYIIASLTPIMLLAFIYASCRNAGVVRPHYDFLELL